MDRDKTCATCKYYDLFPEGLHGGYGKCLRMPPQIAQMTEADVLSDLAPYGEWPVVGFDEWCGEHTPKEQEQPDAN